MRDYRQKRWVIRLQLVFLSRLAYLGSVNSSESQVQAVLGSDDNVLDAARCISWSEAGATRTARLVSHGIAPLPKKVIVANDTMTADTAFRHASEGCALLWRGDFQNARQLLAALARRVARKPARSAASPAEAFRNHRQAQGQRSRTLNMLLIPIDSGDVIPLRRAPDLARALQEVNGVAKERYVMSLREILGIVGAHEWRKKGVDIAAVKGRIHPHYGVFAPTRAEYIALVDNAPLPAMELAFDIGTGTGVLAAVLARRGVRKIIATDNDPRALACARENVERLGLASVIDVTQADLFPIGQAPLVVCNPPWIPARPTSTLENAIYDPQTRMLLGFLAGLADHLTEDGEGWLILSDIAEHLGLRSREELTNAIKTSGLKILGRSDMRPHHGKASDENDPLYLARAAEVTSLWRLARDGPSD
jgi:methylase of polypeptide subunit release factors